tara:strand:+ start:475 stop:1350 length:876 start_codon:yes stop_codon:yes gene_type:complete
METKKLNRGRFTLEERDYIITEYTRNETSPYEIAKQINRDPEAVIKHLNKEIPDWLTSKDEHQDNKNFHKQVLDLSEKSGITYTDAKKSVRKEGSVPVKTIEGLQNLLDSLKAYCDHVTLLREQIYDDVDFWKKASAEWAAAELTSQRRELEIQKAGLYGELMKKHSMPEPPVPTMTAGEFSSKCHTRFKATAGIYFAWEDGQVVYVGTSVNIRRRIKQHKTSGKVRPDMPLSWLEFPQNKLYTTECFYIWCLQPKLNGEIIQDSHYVKDGYSDFSKRVEEAISDGDKGDD